MLVPTQILQAAGTSPSKYGPMLPTNPVIMPVGDSITQGTGSTDSTGYRGPLFRAISAACTTAGLSSSGVVKAGCNAMNGYPGQPASYMAANLASWLSSAGQVDAVLYAAGTNAEVSALYPASAPGFCTTCYGLFMAYNPAGLFFVATPIINPKSTNSPPIPGDYVTQAALQVAAVALMPRAIAVPMPTIPDSEFSDGIHPNDAGYARMALAWKQALNNRGLF